MRCEGTTVAGTSEYIFSLPAPSTFINIQISNLDHAPAYQAILIEAKPRTTEDKLPSSSLAGHRDIRPPSSLADHRNIQSSAFQVSKVIETYEVSRPSFQDYIHAAEQLQMSRAKFFCLPAEMVAEITSYLPPASIANLRLVCHELHAITSPAPPLSEQAWCLFHKRFEESARRTKAPIALACTGCMTLLEPASFQDSQSKRKCDRMDGRFCFNCGQIEGYYNFRTFSYQKKACFSCFGCPEPRKVEEEAMYSLYEGGLPSLVGFRHPDLGKKRWCKGCWRVVTRHVNARCV